MFWNKKVESDGLPITLSLRSTHKANGLFSTFYEARTALRFLAYKTGDTWNGVVGYEEYKKKTDRLEAKLDLILDHLKLKYVPETETKEPAKLVEKTTNDVVGDLAARLYNSNFAEVMDGYIFAQAKAGQPKKKGRPKEEVKVIHTQSPT